MPTWPKLLLPVLESWHSNADDKTMCIIWPFYYAEERAKHFIGQLAGIDKAFLTWVGYRAGRKKGQFEMHWFLISTTKWFPKKHLHRQTMIYSRFGKFPFFKDQFYLFLWFTELEKSPKMSHLKQNSLKWLDSVYESIRRFWQSSTIFFEVTLCSYILAKWDISTQCSNTTIIEVWCLQLEI